MLRRKLLPRFLTPPAILAAMLACAVTASATSISLSVSSSTLTTTPGGNVTFEGTVTNNSGGDLNASDFFFNFPSYDLSSVTPNQDLGVSTDFVIPNTTQSTTVSLFDVTVAPGAVGSFPIEVQLEDLNGDLSDSITVTVVSSVLVPTVPEPDLGWVAGAGLAAFGWRKRSALSGSLGHLMKRGDAQNA